MKFEIRNRFSGEVQLTAEIEAEENASFQVKLGLAVRWALTNGANLRSANLRSANLYGANLGGANLYGADLYGADLRSANLYGADLYGADLYGANLGGADLYGADLYGANLGGADLRSANLYGADLRSANLYGADLRSANLGGADLYGANLGGANLGGAKNSELAQAIASILPEGNLIGWKKCRDNVLVKLEIPADARRSNATGRKCRAEFVRVLAIEGADEAVSHWDNTCIYRFGETVRCTEPFSENRWNECASGIHFWITREEAKAWEY